MRILADLQALFVKSSIAILSIVLNGLDVVAGVVTKIVTMTTNTTSLAGEPVRVVIIGASFAGLATEQSLSSGPNGNRVEITVVDVKEYFEYVPGILRCFIEPSHFTKGLSFPLSILNKKKTTKFVQGQVVAVQERQVVLKNRSMIPFDYLVLAAGSTYGGLPIIKATPLTTTARQAQWNQVAADLEQARTVVIVGGGAVGVELAGEILTKFNNTTKSSKRVVLVDMAPQILTGFPDSTVRYCTDWLKKQGAELYLGHPLRELGENFVTLANGTEVTADLVYKCVGAKPNTEFLKQGPLATALTEKGSVSVNDHLQVQGYSHIFCAGDMCCHAASQEVKLGHTAEVNAHLVAANIQRLIAAPPQDMTSHTPPLLYYPQGVVGNHSTPFIYAMSLGKYDGSLGMNGLVLHGVLPAVVKWMLEWTKVAAARQQQIGVLFWIIADVVSNWLGRTLLPTKKKSHSKAS